MHGNLAKQCGDSVALDVGSPREMFRALAANYPAVRAEIKPHNWIVVVDGRSIGEDALDIQLPERSVTIELHPVISGSGGGLQANMPFIMGAVLIVACSILLATGVGGPFGVS